MLKSPELTRAVSKILKRAERQTPDKSIDTFVNIGILPQIENQDNQIIYGRRGTGKTHIFQKFQSILEKQECNVVCYIDSRNLGSTAQFTDPEVSLKQRCIALFRDILGEIGNSLLEHIATKAPSESKKALEALNEFNKVATEPITSFAKETISRRELTKSMVGGKASAEISSSDPKINVTLGGNAAQEEEKTSSFQTSKEDKIIFSAIQTTLGNVLKNTNTILQLLIDEWSSIPKDLQPYFAEFLKRSFFSNRNVVVKIASLEHRSEFSLQHNDTLIGFELGSDISATLDLDDYFVYDHNPEAITEKFAEILYKHIKSELPKSFLDDNFRISSGKDIASKLFTSSNVFGELTRASEGVVRDLINIFILAFFDAQKRNRNVIDKTAVLEAAQQWFEKDKAKNLDERLQIILRKIVDDVIGKRKARSFLIPRELDKHPTIQRLFDARVLHLMRRGYADKDNPGIRYNIYTLDYGTYIDLLNTSKQPQLGFEFFNNDDKEFVVPFDDKRSIRRIILNEEILQ